MESTIEGGILGVKNHILISVVLIFTSGMKGLIVLIVVNMYHLMKQSLGIIEN